MEPDIALVAGIIVAIFAIPSMLSALTDRRAPRASAITILIAGGLIIYAIQTKPNGYSLQDVPNAFVRVVAQIL
ncbi:hypothetical protein ASD8599_00592 [Ascidiaceihabitans donghaensis]|jgi:hypothetical protein|uniref:50S ribosomal protein L35 n=1 Tax=Ascidiaceihabitans donghaensis TaxID=1510460 RepID=A0A2R8B9Y5_9RHOB|nr:hypothetical protein [Ascidiaceihabitans donghaensis]SPH19852.1 hypothetical protein ASD8599_00592 [Ascidiaceihabitans donghaensis]